MISADNFSPNFRREPLKGSVMLKILVPVDGSVNSLHAVRYVVRAFQRQPAIEIHLLNVQAPFSQYICRYASAQTRHEFHRERAELALLPARQMLAACGAPCIVHMELGQKAQVIAELARKLRCNRIVMGTARKSALIRLIENSTTNKVIELTTVPVEIIAGDAASRAEIYAVPAGVGTLLASLVLAAAE